MSSASDLVSLEQDTGLVKKMQERYILIWNLSKPTQTMIALIVTRLSEDDHLHAGTQQKERCRQDTFDCRSCFPLVSVFGPLNGPVLFPPPQHRGVFLFRASKSREAKSMKLWLDQLESSFPLLPG